MKLEIVIGGIDAKYLESCQIDIEAFLQEELQKQYDRFWEKIFQEESYGRSEIKEPVGFLSMVRTENIS